MAVDHTTDRRRIITGAILIGLLAVALMFRGWILLGLLLLTSGLGLWEFYSFFWGKAGSLLPRLAAIALGSGMLLLGYFQRPQDALICLGAGFFFAALTFLFRWGASGTENAMGGCGIFLTGLMYVPLLLMPAATMTNLLLIFVLGIVAVSDTTAYFTGTRLGRHKLWPKISPNKSVEGAVGSLLGCVIFCVVYGLILGQASWLVFTLLGIVANIFSQLGDLFESALKRSVQIKDSGFILPGHGGVLDRADSFLFVLPLVAALDSWHPLF